MGKEESEKPQYRKYVVFFLSLIGLLFLLSRVAPLEEIDPSWVLPIVVGLFYLTIMRGEYR